MCFCSRTRVETRSSSGIGYFFTLFYICQYLRIVIFSGMDNESTLTFVELYKAKPVLWDPTQPK
jgi:hypothetical protein